MAESRLIQKQLAGKEDLLLGIGTVKQGRASGIKTITKLNATHFGGVLVVDTINDLNSLDKNQLDEQVVFVKETGNTYSYNGTSWVNKTTITVENIEDLATYTGLSSVIVKDINRGGIFVSKTDADVDPNTGSLYTVNGGTVFAKLGGGFWVRQYSGAVNVKWFGAKGDGVTDDTESFLSFVSGNTNLYIPEGNYIINSDLQLEYNTKLTGTKSTILDFSRGTSTNHIKTKDVTLMSLPNLSQNVKAGDRNIYFETAHGLEYGDIIVFYNPTDFSWSAERAYYRKGERARVGKVISSTHIMLETNLLDNYDAGTSTQMGRHEFVVGVNIQDIYIKGRSSKTVVTNGLSLHKCVDSKVSGVNIENASYACCDISECFNVSITDSSFREDMNNVSSGDYGLSIANSQNIFVNNCYAAANRHGIATGGSSGFGKGVNYHLLFSQCTIGTIGGAHAADMHSNTAYSGYDNCIINGTVDFGGHSNFIRNCKIIEGNTEEANDSAIYLIAQPSMEHTISGNTIVSTKTRDNINTFPLINTTLDANTVKGGTLVIKDNVINWDNTSSSSVASSVIGTNYVRLHNIPSTEKRNFIVEGNIFTNKSEYCGAFVRLRRSGSVEGTKGFDYISIQNNKAEKIANALSINTSDNDKTNVANEVIISNNSFKDIKSTGMVCGNVGTLRVSNNNFIDYLQTVTSSSVTNSAAHCFDIGTVIEYGNFTVSSYGLDQQRMAFGNIINLCRGQKANLGGKIDVTNNITNAISM